MSDNAIAEKAIVIAIAHCSLLKLEPFCNGSPHNKGELERVLPSLLLRLEAYTLTNQGRSLRITGNIKISWLEASTKIISNHCSSLPTLSHLLYSWNCIYAFHCLHELMHGMDIEHHEEISNLIVSVGRERVDRKVQLVCDFLHNINKEMITVYALYRNTDRIDTVWRLFERNVNNIVTIL